MTGGFVVLLTAACCALPACISDHTYADVVSTRPLERGELDRLVRAPASAEGEDGWTAYLTFLRTNWSEPTLDAAVRDALANSPGAVALSDVEIEHAWAFMPPLYFRHRLRVRGTPLFEPSTSPADKSP